MSALQDFVHEHRMLDTFGGYDWGDPIRLWTIDPPEPEPVAWSRRPSLPWADFEAELDHFRSFGVSAAVTLPLLNVSARTAYRKCTRRKRFDLAAWINETNDTKTIERKEAA